MSSFLQGEVVGTYKGHPVATQVKYFPEDDPYAMVFVFFTPEPVTWTFARDLLIQGMTEKSGEGDVQFRPEGEFIIMSIANGGSIADFHFHKADMSYIVNLIQDLMPPGQESESIDWETELASILDP